MDKIYYYLKNYQLKLLLLNPKHHHLNVRKNDEDTIEYSITFMFQMNKTFSGIVVNSNNTFI